MNEIIIDGCNVAECKHRISCLNDNNDIQCKVGIYRDDDVIIIPICKDNPNCYFKQLQRAKAELEQYKKSKQASYETMQAEWNKAVNELRDLKASDKIEFKQHYKAENERLKKDIHNIYENCKCCDEFYMDKCSYIKKENKYKQALEEIKELLRGHQIADKARIEIILDLINKALND